MERKKRSKGRGWESCYVKKIYGTFGVEMRAYGQKLVQFCKHTHTHTHTHTHARARVSYSSIDIQIQHCKACKKLFHMHRDEIYTSVSNICHSHYMTLHVQRFPPRGPHISASDIKNTRLNMQRSGYRCLTIEISENI